MRATIVIIALVMLSIFYGCIQPRANSQNGSGTISDLGIYVFTEPTEFQPAKCIQLKKIDYTIISNTLAVVNWNYDSIGSSVADLPYLQVTPGVGNGMLYLNICNQSQEVITLPTESVINYELFNFNASTNVSAIKESH